MRMPTLSQYKSELSAMAKQFDTVQRLQVKASSGKNIQRSSDDPLLALQIKSVQTHLNQLKNYQLNNTLAQARTELITNRLEEVQNIINLSDEAIQKAQNDTLSSSDRKILAGELQDLLNRLLIIGNTQDATGEYVFSGFNVNSPAYRFDGEHYEYVGSRTAGTIPLGENATVAYNLVGDNLFGGVKTGNGQYSLHAAPQNQGTGFIAFANQNPSAMASHEDYVITVVTNANGQLAYQIIGTESGQIIPKLPLSTPADAPSYIDGQQVKLDNLEIQLKGEPKAGDVFEITKSQSTNLFESLQETIKALKTPVVSDKDKAQLHQNLATLGATFKRFGDHFRSYMGEMGHQGKLIEDEMNLSKNRILDEQMVLSRLTDADLPQVISELTQKLTSLEVAQQSYLKLHETFNRLLLSR